MPHLENWSTTLDPRDPYLAPELREPCLQGRLGDKGILTSPIRGVEGDAIRTQSGTLYTLGEPDPLYEEQFPGARERLFKTWSAA